MPSIGQVDRVAGSEGPGSAHWLLHKSIGVFVAREPLRLGVESQGPVELQGDLGKIDERAGAMSIGLVEGECSPRTDAFVEIHFQR